MQAYKAILKDILTLGTWKSNRTGIDSIALPYPAVFRHDMRTGFPILTARQAPFKSAAAELCGFLRGYTSAADFRELGCNYWNGNANDPGKEGSPNQWLTNPFRKGEDDLGSTLYGAAWRGWPAQKLVLDYTSEAGQRQTSLLARTGWKCISDVVGPEGEDASLWVKKIDQLGDCIKTIITNPDSRRILFHAWNPATLDELALPACHVFYQFLPNSKTKELGLALTIRSNDYPLGFPSNCVEAAQLLVLVAHLTGYTPSWLTIVSNDCHVYSNQLDFVNEYLDLPEHPLPTLELHWSVPSYQSLSEEHGGDIQTLAQKAVECLNTVMPDDFHLRDYQHGPKLVSPAMAV